MYFRYSSLKVKESKGKAPGICATSSIIFSTRVGGSKYITRAVAGSTIADRNSSRVIAGTINRAAVQ